MILYLLPVALLGLFMLLPLSLALFLPCLALLFTIFFLRVCCINQRVQLPTIAFFHPYCNAGGGGERVLWQCVLGVVEKFPRTTVYIYTGDTDASPDQIISNAEKCFGLELPRQSIQFVYLSTRCLVEAKCYPVFTLLGQSLGSMVLGFEALWKLQPAYFVDSMGYAFTYLLATLCGCEVISYVHYPTISTDMLGAVKSRAASHNNSSIVARNPLLTSAKLLYYKLFAWLYAKMGALSSLVFVNSSWTQGHIDHIWGVPDRTVRLYPPCNTTTFLQISGARTNNIVSVAQFRPEKNHRLQIQAFKCFVEKTGRDDVLLTLVGGVRNQRDRARVEELRELARVLQVEDLVKFEVSVPYSRLHQILSTSLMGLHTMWNEHFGIGVVEFMAAGIIPIAHDSGGPKIDIVVPGSGFLASTKEGYCDHMIRVLELGEEEREAMREKGRKHVQSSFSDEAFREQFVETCFSVAGLDLEDYYEDD